MRIDISFHQIKNHRAVLIKIEGIQALFVSGLTICQSALSFELKRNKDQGLTIEALSF